MSNFTNINNNVFLTILEIIGVACISFIFGILFERIRCCRRERYVV